MKDYNKYSGVFMGTVSPSCLKLNWSKQKLYFLNVLHLFMNNDFVMVFEISFKPTIYKQSFEILYIYAFNNKIYSIMNVSQYFHFILHPIVTLGVLGTLLQIIIFSITKRYEKYRSMQVWMLFRYTSQIIELILILFLYMQDWYCIL